MAEIRTVTTLRSKRAEIIASIANYEKKLAQTRADLAHITLAITIFETLAITIFEASGDRDEIPPYVDIHRWLQRHVPLYYRALETTVLYKADQRPFDWAGSRAGPRRRSRFRRAPWQV